MPSATIRLVIGLSAMFVLAPSTRFGYFIYPAALVVWLVVAQAGRKYAGRDGAQGQEGPPGPAPDVVPAPG